MVTLGQQKQKFLGSTNKEMVSTAKKTAAAAPFVSNPVSQNTNFGSITVNAVPISGSASLFGGGGSGAINTNINQTVKNVTDIVNEISYQTINTVTTSNNYSAQSSNIFNSPYAGAVQESAPSTIVTPTATSTQTATQTPTLTDTTAQSGAPLGGMSWWQWLIIGGVAIVGIWMLKDVFKSNKKSVARYAIAKGA